MNRASVIANHFLNNNNTNHQSLSTIQCANEGVIPPVSTLVEPPIVDLDGGFPTFPQMLEVS
jgi:hypothetical protein